MGLTYNYVFRNFMSPTPMNAVGRVIRHLPQATVGRKPLSSQNPRAGALSSPMRAHRGYPFGLPTYGYRPLRSSAVAPQSVARSSRPGASCKASPRLSALPPGVACGDADAKNRLSPKHLQKSDPRDSQMGAPTRYSIRHLLVRLQLPPFSCARRRQDHRLLH